MKKKFLALLLAALMVVGLLPMTVSVTAATEYIYLNTGGSSLWNKDGATFAVWTWGGSLGSSVAVPMQLESGDIYKVDKSLLGDSVLFVRVVSGETFNGEDWSANTVWNQTGDLNVPAGSDNCYEITGWAAKDGQWTVYTPAAPTYAITNGTAQDANGSITAAETAASGATVTVTVTPDKGYQLKSLVVLSAVSLAPPIIPAQDAQDETKYTFTMPDHPVIVKAEFEEKAITIADILPDDFPTSDDDFPENSWVNENGSKLMLWSGLLYAHNEKGGDYVSTDVTAIVVTKDGDNYKYTGADGVTVTFIMDDGVLASIKIENCNDEAINVTYSAPAHTHAFTYAAKDNKLTATCKEGCDKGYNVTPLTLTLTAPASLVYDGNAKSFTFADGEADAWTGAGLELPTIFYNIKQSGQSTYLPLMGTLKSAGDYMAQITVDGQTAQAYFSIEAPHTHNPVKVNGQAATETAAGWSDYYECKDSTDACHKYFEDANAKVEITDLNAWKAQGGKGYIAPLVHSITPVNGKNATDTEAGYKPYYECKNCGKYYEDASGFVEITDLAKWKAQGGNGYIAKLEKQTDPTDPKSPETGDTSNMTLWVMLLALSSTGLCACLVLGKKRNKC